jgi:ribosomal RNA-processing protein 7
VQGRQTNSDGDGISMGGISSAVAVAAGKKAEEGSRQLLPHFYRFQRREKRRDELLELREQFEADKKKVQELKAARKFKPL